MTKSEDVAFGFCLGLIVALIGCSLTYRLTWNYYLYLGRAQVASGQFECELVEDKAISREWKCHETKDSSN